MNTATKLSSFLLGLVAVFGASYGVGQLTGPVTATNQTPHDGPTHTTQTPNKPTNTTHPTPTRTTTTVNGYTITLNGTLTPGTTSTLHLNITHHGKPVTDLQPYLGGYGHLVALRDGDLAYLRVHPTDNTPGPQLTFQTQIPTPGTYRLFLGFQHQDNTHIAELIATTSPAATPSN